MGKKTNAVLRFLSSGKFENPRDERVLDEMIRYIVMNMTFISGSALLAVFGITVFLEGNTVRAMLDFSVAVLGVSSVVILRTKAPFHVVAGITISAFAVLCAVLVFSYGERGFAGLWIFALPPIAIFTLGMRFGTVLSVLLFIATCVAMFIPGFTRLVYPLPIGARYVGVYLLVSILTVVYERVRLSKDRWARRLTAELAVERDKIVTMQNNISSGLFLMDRDLVVQPAYSVAMENLLAAGDLAGKKFTALLSSSFKAKDLETVADYFGMIMDGKLDAAMLKDINPLQSFTYTPVDAAAGGKQKNLKCGFVRVEQGQGGYYILGTIEDITHETELQKQLEAEEAKRQEEMRSLFEVMQVEPKVFGDFVEDMDAEFDRINGILREGRLSNTDMMVEMYQSAHAIKSNAVILGLSGFGGKVHGLESQIKEFRDRGTISFEDMLHISVELERLMKEKDKFRETIDKIRSFGSGEGAKGDVEVFVETLAKAVDRVSADTGKKARLEVTRLDPAALASGPRRRLMKEVLTQLARNAVYHGIESPQGRREKGKDEWGRIKLSVVLEAGTIHLSLEDDGGGLDFEKIAARAKELGLLKKPEDRADREYLSGLIFTPALSTAAGENLHAGRGVGLSLVHSRVAEAGGTVSVRSGEGTGTTFEIALPAEGEPV